MKMCVTSLAFGVHFEKGPQAITVTPVVTITAETSEDSIVALFYEWAPPQSGTDDGYNLECCVCQAPHPI
jgi:hypothetical protein